MTKNLNKKFAVWNNNLEMAKALLKFGADVNIQDNNQLIPLHFAVRRSDGVPMTRLLLEYGSKIDYRNKHGRTPLFYASKETTQLLIDFGAKIESEDDDSRTQLLERRKSVDLW